MAAHAERSSPAELLVKSQSGHARRDRTPSMKSLPATLETVQLMSAVVEQQARIMEILDVFQGSSGLTKDPLGTLRDYVEGMREQCDLFHKETFDLNVSRQRLKDRNSELELHTNELRTQRIVMEKELEQVQRKTAKLESLCAQLNLTPRPLPTTPQTTILDPATSLVTPHMFYSTQPMFFHRSLSHDAPKVVATAAPATTAPPPQVRSPPRAADTSIPTPTPLAIPPTTVAHAQPANAAKRHSTGGGGGAIASTPTSAKDQSQKPPRTPEKRATVPAGSYHSNGIGSSKKGQSEGEVTSAPKATTPEPQPQHHTTQVPSYPMRKVLSADNLASPRTPTPLPPSPPPMGAQQLPNQHWATLSWPNIANPVMNSSKTATATASYQSQVHPMYFSMPGPSVVAPLGDVWNPFGLSQPMALQGPTQGPRSPEGLQGPRVFWQQSLPGMR